jgi:hypothetical protein
MERIGGRLCLQKLAMHREASDYVYTFLIDVVAR